MTEAAISVDLWHKLKELLNVREPDLDEVKETILRIPDKDRLESSWSPVIAAIKNNQEKVLDLLLKSGFSINAVQNDHSRIYGWCAVGAAIDAKNYKLAKHLVENCKASSDMVRQGCETLLTAAITRSDWSIITLLLDDLKASPNQGVQFDLNGGQVWPIHLAIWCDFYKGHSDWRMTKLLLKKGAKLASKSDWEVLNGKVVLGIPRGTEGDAATFAEALKQINQGRIEENSLDRLIEMLKEHSIIQEINKRIQACMSVSLSDLAGLINSKVFFSSPLVTAAKHGRYDLVELMVRTLGFDVNALEEMTGLNPLAAAVESGNTEMVRYLVEELGANVNAPLLLELVPGKKFKCSSLALVVAQNLSDPELWKLLVEDFGADVNFELEVESHTSSLLHHAIYCSRDHKSTKIISLLLSYGARTDKICWTWLSNGFIQATPMELALHLQARSDDDLLWLEVVHKLTTVLVKEETERLKKLDPADLIHQADTERLLSAWHRSKMMTHVAVLTQKIEAANLNDEKIKALKSKKDYLTEEEIAIKEKEFWQKVSRSRAIEAEIKSIVKHENFMSEEKIRQQELQAEQFKRSCLTCEKEFLAANLLQCSKKVKPHVFCNRCIYNKKHCPWCECENFGKICATLRSPPGSTLEPMSQIVDPIISEAKNLLARLQTLQNSKDLIHGEELEILTRKHEAEMERANILNKLIASHKKSGDPEYLSQLEKSLRELKASLRMPHHETGGVYSQDGPMTVSTPLRATQRPESSATVPIGNPPTTEPQVEGWERVESGDSSNVDGNAPKEVPQGAQSKPPKYRYWIPRSILTDDDHYNEAQDVTEEANATWPANPSVGQSGSENALAPDTINYNDFHSSQPSTSAGRSHQAHFWY